MTTAIDYLSRASVRPSNRFSLNAWKSIAATNAIYCGLGWNLLDLFKVNNVTLY